jgi:hypothetical protein
VEKLQMALCCAGYLALTLAYSVALLAVLLKNH